MVLRNCKDTRISVHTTSGDERDREILQGGSGSGRRLLKYQAVGGSGCHMTSRPTCAEQKPSPIRHFLLGFPDTGVSARIRGFSLELSHSIYAEDNFLFTWPFVCQLTNPRDSRSFRTGCSDPSIHTWTTLCSSFMLHIKQPYQSSL